MAGQRGRNALEDARKVAKEERKKMDQHPENSPYANGVNASDRQSQSGHNKNLYQLAGKH